MTLSAPDPFDRLLAHQRVVVRFARRLARDQHEADDVIQETWLAAVTTPPRHERALPAWLSRIVKRRMTGLSRRLVRRAEFEALAGEDRTAPSTLEACLLDELRDEVRSAIEQLDEIHRDVISLRYSEDLSHQEIATRLGLPVETVRARLKRGLGQLRDRFTVDGKLDRSRWCLVFASWIEEERGLRGMPLEVASGLASAAGAGLGTWLMAAALLLSFGLIAVTFVVPLPSPGVAALSDSLEPARDTGALDARVALLRSHGREELSRAEPRRSGGPPGVAAPPAADLSLRGRGTHPIWWPWIALPLERPLEPAELDAPASPAGRD